MKKYVAYIGIFLILTGVFVPVSSVHADKAQYDACIKAGGTAINCNRIFPQTTPVDPNNTINLRNTDPTGANITPTGPVLPSGTTSSEPTGCGLLTPGSCIAVFTYGILKIMAFFLGFAGKILNYVLNYTIVNMSANVKTMTGINTGWKVIRDLMNIAFIFILVYEGIKLIIGVGNLGKIRSFIAFVVLASLLINFSLFFTKVIIDASNVATVGFYNSILGDRASDPENDGLANVFMKSMGLSSFYDSNSGFEQFAGNMGNDSTGMIVFSLMGSLLFLILTFIFLAVTVMFSVRYLVLILLLTLSPVGFMGMALPGLKKQSGEWWDTLLGQCLFGPIYMIMTWVVLVLIASPNFISVGGGGSWNIYPGADGKIAPGSIALLFNFALIIGLAIASLITAKKYATQGAKQVGELSGKATTFAGGALLGSGAALSRNTLGRAGNAISNNEWLKEKASNNALARLTLRTGNKAAGSAFDFRNTKVAERAKKDLGIDLGKGADIKKVNFRKDLEGKANAAAENAKLLKPSDAAKEAAKARDEEKARPIQEEASAAEKLYKEKEVELANLRTEKERLSASITRDTLPDAQRRIEDDVRRIEGQMEARNQEIVAQRAINKAKTQQVKDILSAKEEEKKIDSAYEERVKKYAETFENPKARWLKNALKVGGGAYIGSAFGLAGAVVGGGTGSLSMNLNTKADNREIAKKIKSVTKSKSEAEKILESLKKVREEDEKKEKEEEKKPEPAQPATPAGGNPTT